jgi:two-component system chemotaxis response regulator CheY
MIGVSVDTLRYYDEIGLLKPARISRETGYRYYTDDQAAALSRIKELKLYGFSLSEIKRMLNQEDIDSTDVYLNRYWALEAEKRKLQEAIDGLAKKINQRQGDCNMNKKVLLVDDAPFMRSICEDILTREGYVIAGEACDGVQAVDLYKTLCPELVLLDIVMPNCDGIGALQGIIEYDVNARILMVYAMSQARIVAEALLKGAQDFLAKPFQIEDLLRKAKSTLEQTEPISRDTAQKLLDASKEDKSVLGNYAVDQLVAMVYGGADAGEVEATLARLQKGSPAEQQGFDLSIEERAYTNVRLDRLEQGVKEILEILRK